MYGLRPNEMAAACQSGARIMPTRKPSPVDVFWDRCEGPIRFGVNDCCIALADTILAAGGPDLMAGYRGRYSTAIGFARAFRRAGHETLAAACEAAFRANGEQ